MSKVWFLLLLPVLMIGCGERYRYPCQDPENWNEKLCQKPFCSANGTCPEDLKHYEKEPSAQRPAQTLPANKGECK